MPRRRRQQGLERVLGTPALFATAYGNVGSSIYYALGVTAAIALGLTPLVFVISGLIFACTAATYAEATALFPEAGGSSSFARPAFNELVSLGAARPPPQQPGLDPAGRDRGVRNLPHAAAHRPLGAAGGAQLCGRVRHSARARPAEGIQERPGARPRPEPGPARSRAVGGEDLR